MQTRYSGDCCRNAIQLIYSPFSYLFVVGEQLVKRDRIFQQPSPIQTTHGYHKATTNSEHCEKI